MGRTINKLFHGIEKYKIRSCIIYLSENQWTKKIIKRWNLCVFKFEYETNLQKEITSTRKHKTRGARRALEEIITLVNLKEAWASKGSSSRSGNEREASVVAVNSQRRKIRIHFYRALAMQTTLILSSDRWCLGSMLMGSKKWTQLK